VKDSKENPWGGSRSSYSVMHLARPLILIAALLGGSGVAIGAFGAHGLQTRLEARFDKGEEQTIRERRLQQFETGVRYQLVHALAILGLAGLSPIVPIRGLRQSAIWMLIGCLIFSGSLYLLVVLEQPRLGAVTPLGGVALLIGWSILAVSTWSQRSTP
jgi:uncharacterized membrane protein YgdD (TMEM256/DUF423 family)